MTSSTLYRSAPWQTLRRHCLLSGLLLASVASGCRTCCPRSLEKNVVDARQASLSGLDAMQQGRWNEAEQIFATAVKASPVDERARGCYAETLWQRGACREAVSQMREAVKLSGSDPHRLVQLGEMYLALGQVNEAAQCAEEATSRNCRVGSAWALKGDVCVARRHYDDALASYHRSIAYNAHQPRIQLAISQIYLNQERPQRALSTLETLAEQFPPGEIPGDVYATQGICLAAMNRPHDAVEMLKSAVEKGPANADWFAALASAQQATGDGRAALASVNQALAQQPNHLQALALKSSLETRESGTLTANVPSATDRVIR